jgi:hypothetical protein
MSISVRSGELGRSCWNASESSGCSRLDHPPVARLLARRDADADAGGDPEPEALDPAHAEAVQLPLLAYAGFITGLDSDGAVQWARAIAVDDGASEFTAIDQLGRTVVGAGLFRGTLAISGTPTISQGYDIFIVQYDL